MGRIKFFGLFIFALCKVQTVCFEKLAAAFDAEANVHQGLAIPILYTMMPKFGNSSTAERIELMQRYIDLFGIDTIDCLLADREFVGDQWLAYLNTRRIRYHIRIRENFWIDIPKNGHRVKATWLFNHL